MKLNIDNPFFDAMGRFGDIIIVNLLFVLCSLPIVTAGASACAMYGVFLRMAAGTEGTVYKTFFRCFGKYLKKSLTVWIFLLLSGGILMFDILFLGHVGMYGIWKAVGILTGCLIFLWEMIFAWIFAVIVQEEGRLKELTEKALKLSVLHFPATLLIMLFNNIPLLCLLFGLRCVLLAAPLYLVFGFGLTAYVNTAVMRRW